MPLQEILEELPKLTQAELAEVRQHLLALAAVDGIEVSDDWLLQGIIAVLEDRGLGNTVPARFRITNRRQFHGYLGKAEKVRKALESGTTFSKLDRLALGRLLARCLAESIEEFRPLSFNAMLQHVEQALPALDKCFPGYLQAGMLRMLISPVPRAKGRQVSPRRRGNDDQSLRVPGSGNLHSE